MEGGTSSDKNIILVMITVSAALVAVNLLHVLDNHVSHHRAQTPQRCREHVVISYALEKVIDLRFHSFINSTVF